MAGDRHHIGRPVEQAAPELETGPSHAGLVYGNEPQPRLRCIGREARRFHARAGVAMTIEEVFPIPTAIASVAERSPIGELHGVIGDGHRIDAGHVF